MIVFAILKEKKTVEIGQKEQTPPITDNAKPPIAEVSPEKVDTSLDEIEVLVNTLSIDMHTARVLHQNGYKKPADLEGATVDDIITIEGINPTRARQILQAYSKYQDDKLFED